MIEIALRFDDPSPTSDHALERGIFAILRDLAPKEKLHWHLLMTRPMWLYLRPPGVSS